MTFRDMSQLQLRILEIPGFNFGRKIIYPEVSRCFPYSF